MQIPGNSKQVKALAQSTAYLKDSIMYDIIQAKDVKEVSKGSKHKCPISHLFKVFNK